MKSDDGRLVLNCFAGCKFEDIIDVLQARGIIGTDRLCRARRALAPYVKPGPTEHLPDARAALSWNNSVPLQGTLGQTYLGRRGILNMPPSLRYHRETRAMLAGFQRPDGKIVGAQSTFLTKDAEKITSRFPRLTYADMRDGAVRLAAAAEVMGLAEGTETALSAMAMSGVPTWVTLGAGRMHDVALPDLVREVHIFADNDKSGSGRNAAHRTADVHLKAGRCVKVWFPPEGVKDFNQLATDLADHDSDMDRLMGILQATALAPKIGCAA